MALAQFFCVLAIGLIFGSFATALAYRIPRGISMTAEPRSRCSSCKAVLQAPDLVPLFSYLFLRGRCRYCKNPIGARYALIELAVTVLCLSFYSMFGMTLGTVGLLMLAPVLVAIIDIDLREKIIPDSLNISIAGIAILLLLAQTIQEDFSFIGEQLPGMVAGACMYALAAWLLRALVTRLVKREAMGWGDIKFFAAAGLWLGLNPDASVLFLLASGLSGIVLALALGKRLGTDEIPFGPSLVLALIVTILFYPPGIIVPGGF